MKDHRLKLEWLSRAASAAAAMAMALVVAAYVPAATPVAVDIKDFTFSPPTLTVPVGTTVTWTNHDEAPHTITSPSGAFGSAGLSNDDRFAQTFSHAGTYQYFCSLHPNMRATVIVK